MAGPGVPRVVGKLKGRGRAAAFWVFFLVLIPSKILKRIVRLGAPLSLADSAVINLEDGTPVHIRDMSSRLVTLRELFQELNILPNRDQVFLSAMGKPNDHRRVRDFDILMGADDIVIIAPIEQASTLPNKL